MINNLIFIFLPLALLIDVISIDKPYIPSDAIEFFSYYIAFPISTIPFFLMTLDFINSKRVFRSKVSFSRSYYKNSFILFLFFSISITLLSLNIMAIPTSRIKYYSYRGEIKAIGVSKHSTKFGIGYDLLLSKNSKDKIYRISIPERIYEKYIEKCGVLDVPIKSSSWWAGYYIRDRYIDNSIKNHCGN